MNSALQKTFLLVVAVFLIRTSISIHTWPDGKTRNQIDHVLISRRFHNSLLDVRTFRGADVYSDHNLVVAKLRMRPAALNTTGNNIIIILARTPEIGQGLRRLLSCGARNRTDLDGPMIIKECLRVNQQTNECQTAHSAFEGPTGQYSPYSG